ncbi:MAG: superoxide dismutase family protein [Rhizomicrobium sp.]
MKRAALCTALCLVLGALPAGLASAAAAKARAVAKLIGLDGAPAGTAIFTATTHGVLIQIDLKGLSPGAHAVHVHTAGSCDPKVGFTSAGPHYAPDAAKTHGYLSAHGPHAGDLPNAYAAADGSLHASMISNAFSLGNGKKSIFDRDGAAIVVHAKGDDYMSQPAGAAGDRVACGVIMRTVAPGSRKGPKHPTHK